MSNERLHILLKTDTYEFFGYCYCNTCKPWVDQDLTKSNYEFIKIGSSKEVFNQEKILNKLYGKTK